MVRSKRRQPAGDVAQGEYAIASPRPETDPPQGFLSVIQFGDDVDENGQLPITHLAGHERRREGGAHLQLFQALFPALDPLEIVRRLRQTFVGVVQNAGLGKD